MGPDPDDTLPAKEPDITFPNATAARRYVWRIVELMLANELDVPVPEAQWLFGGVTRLEDRRLVRLEARKVLRQLRAKTR